MTTSSPAKASSIRADPRLWTLSALALGLGVGFVMNVAGHPQWSGPVWIVATLPVLATLLFEIVSSVRRGEYGLDVVAALSMTAALVFGEYLAAAVVALMYAGGQYLESYAEGRARREMTALLSRVPRTAMRHRDGGLDEVPLDDVVPGDRLLVRRGDVVPVDGTLPAGVALLDESALTGESLPVRRNPGADIMSGATNSGEAFDLVATRRAAESTFAGIVRLVAAAQSARAPMTRLADRYAIGFLAATVALAAATWFWTGDPVRLVAVLVVATPCPLILAVPVALVAGLSRAARAGILIKGGKALETMAGVRALVVDKTGTLTTGTPQVTGIETDVEPDHVLRLAAALDQASPHPIAQALVAAARTRNMSLPPPTAVVETPGEGIEGEVEGQAVIVGGVDFVHRRLGLAGTPSSPPAPGAAVVAVAAGGDWLGTISLADEIRLGTADLMTGLRREGIERIVLATGDRRAVADTIAAGLGLDAIEAELTPEQKILTVLSARKYGPVMMVGDGVNDAPALAAADIGIAMGARGAAASAEAADAVLIEDDLGRVLPAIRIARRTRRIALQSVFAGIGLSVAGMIAAAFGYIAPVEGALLQEAIDVAVILNAMRALR